MILDKCERVSNVLFKVVLSLVGMASFAILLWVGYTIPHWMQFWDQAGNDITKVAEAINNFERSMHKNTSVMAQNTDTMAHNTDAMATTMPQMLAEMQQMRVEVQALKSEVAQMKAATSHIAVTVPSQMNQMQHRMTPGGMMSPSNWVP